MDGPLGAQTTRRELIRAAAAGGLLAGGVALAGAPQAMALAQTDVELVGTLAASEMLAVFVYGHALRSGQLSPYNEHLARRLLSHERAHLRSLSGALDRLGGTPPAPLDTIPAADALLAASGIPVSLTQLRTESDFLRLLLRLEVVLERSYYAAMSKLTDPDVQSTAAEVLAAEAQHATVLIDALVPGDVTKSVPESFVEGNPGDARI